MVEPASYRFFFWRMPEAYFSSLLKELIRRFRQRLKSNKPLTLILTFVAYDTRWTEINLDANLGQFSPNE